MTFDKIRSAQEALAKDGGRPLGSLLWWALNGNRIEHERLANLAALHGLDGNFLPKEVKPTAAFRRAWRHASSKLAKGLLLRPISETDDLVLIGLVREHADVSAQDLEYDVVAKVAFDKATHVVRTDVENQVTSEIKKLYRYHQAHTTEDIRSMLTGFLSEAGVSLRDSGGVYFVPAAYQRTLDALCAVVEAVGHNVCYQLPIAESEATRTTLREVAQRTLDSELAQLQADLDRFDLSKVRQSTLERKLDGFEDLRARVTLFSRVLSFKADALDRRIQGIQSGLRRQLEGVDGPSEAQAEPPPSSAAFTIEPFAADVGF